VAASTAQAAVSVTWRGRAICVEAAAITTITLVRVSADIAGRHSHCVTARSGLSVGAIYRVLTLLVWNTPHTALEMVKAGNAHS
jgi:hypothetical protein